MRLNLLNQQHHPKLGFLPLSPNQFVSEWRTKFKNHKPHNHQIHYCTCAILIHLQPLPSHAMIHKQRKHDPPDVDRVTREKVRKPTEIQLKGDNPKFSLFAFTWLRKPLNFKTLTKLWIPFFSFFSSSLSRIRERSKSMDGDNTQIKLTGGHWIVSIFIWCWAGCDRLLFLGMSKITICIRIKPRTVTFTHDTFTLRTLGQIIWLRWRMQS